MTGYESDDRNSILDSSKNCSVYNHIQKHCATHRRTCSVNTADVSHEIKRTKRKAKYSLSSGSEILRLHEFALPLAVLPISHVYAQVYRVTPSPDTFQKKKILQCVLLFRPPCPPSLENSRIIELFMMHISCLLGRTTLLTPWSRVLPEKLKHPELLKKSPAFYGTRRFITAFTRARHLSLSLARLIQSMPPHPTSRRSILILSSHLRLGLPSKLEHNSFLGAMQCHLQPSTNPGLTNRTLELKEYK
jgi:hypothetical protein